MLRAFWTWDPVSSGTYRAFNEPHAYQNNKWFFDKSVWQKMFRAMGGCGFDALVLGNTHPFPFMIDLAAYPDAKVLSDEELSTYRTMHQWIFETALDYDIAPYLAFYSIYYPSGLLEAKGISDQDISTPTDFALEYTSHCFRTVLETYPDLAGFIVDIGGVSGARTQFVQQAILDTMDSARHDATIYLRGFEGEPADLTDAITRRGDRPIHYIAPYTHKHLVDASADADFTKWVDAVGPELVMAEVDASNFEPWTSFSYDTIEEITQGLSESDANGILLQPLSVYEWPHTSDTYFKYQWQRDMAWYLAWGGASVEQMHRRGQPKWLVRNHRLIPGFTAGSRILELLSLYVAGDKEYGWCPQFCAIRDGQAHLLSIADMLSMQTDPAFEGRDWWEEVTGDSVVRLEEYVKSGTPEDAYGPEELIEELTDLSEQAIAAGEKGMRSASGEKELPSFARDALCMGKLGLFYMERFRAALAHGRNDDTETLEHMARALELFKEIQTVDSTHRESFRVRMDHSAADMDWSRVVNALEAEYADASDGRFERGASYRI